MGILRWRRYKLRRKWALKIIIGGVASVTCAAAKARGNDESA